jgi:cell division protein FtsB|tara:strand:+ start:1053 stop:1343 length:291 start_codon:yes stop_codon:yes gene_type:complete
MKWIVVIMSVFLVGLQYRLWVGEGSLAEKSRLARDIALQESENVALRERNRQLAVDVLELKTGLDGIEERARYDLGMVKKGETFFMIVDDKPEATQ